MAMRQRSDEASALRVIEGGAVDIDTRIAHMEERYLEAAQAAAPYRQQLELARELVVLRSQRLAGAGAAIETAELTKHVVDEMAETGIYTQQVINGLRDDLGGRSWPR